MIDEQKPAQQRSAADEPSKGTARPREKYPPIPLPERRRTTRPEIAASPAEGGGWLKRCCIVSAWCVVLVLATGAVLRLFLYDRWIPLVWWNNFTLYVYLPAYLCLPVALAMRQWRLATITVLVIACHVVWVAPDFLRSETGTSMAATRTSGGRRLRLYYQNVNKYADDYDQRIAEILAAEPDVIALVEFVPTWEAAVRESEIPEKFPYNTLREKPQSQQLAVFSKLPIEEVEYRFIADRRLVVAATLQIEGRPLHLFCIHAPRPLWDQAEQYWTFSQEITDWIRKTAGPRVIVGDFNATQHAAWYKRLTTLAGLHSAHRDVGRGYATSWPNDSPLPRAQFSLPPIRIDHVLLSEELQCQDIREGGGGLSDHKPLICDLLLASGDGEKEDGGSGE
jgi:endonuclease/exonuclease/phosphatase (EEP) superfamily protein YafD